MITYRPDFKLYWPDYDHAPEKCFAYVKKHLPDMDYAISLCRKRRVCVQAGGHAGLWPRKLSDFFGRVLTFESEPALFSCLKHNTSTYLNVTAAPRALGDACRAAKMRPHKSAGSWRVSDDGTVPVDQITIDSLRLPICDALFLDIEGHEVPALRGAIDTIRRFRPVIQVEELQRVNGAVSRHMAEIGYTLKRKIGRDLVYVP